MQINYSTLPEFDPIIQPLPSKEEMPRTEFQILTDRYVELTSSLWERRIDLYLTHICILVRRMNGVGTTLRYFIKQFTSTLIATQTVSIPFPKCDVILYYSSAKTIWQAVMEKLAQKLAEDGFRVLLGNNRKMFEVSINSVTRRVEKHEVDNYLPMLDYGYSRLRNISNLFRSFAHTIVLLLALRRDPVIFREIFRNPFAVWNELFTSLHDLDFSNRLIDQSEPRLIITNHVILRVASELLSARRSNKAYRIYLCNENPAGLYFPAGICDEIWFWNRLHVASHQLLMMPGAHFQSEIVGHGETDAALYLDEEETSAERSLKEKTEGKKVFLFLSTYYPPDYGMDQVGEMVYQELMELLSEVSSRHTDWCFVYKMRPTRDRENPPGIQKLQKLPNWLFAQGNINYLRFLNWDNLAIVAADPSLGLITAAGMKKLPLLLNVPSRENHLLSNLEQIALNVKTSRELDEILENYDTLYPAYIHWLQDREQEIFPYRGQVIERMRDLCLKHLRTATEH